jgi:hypothetical protein
VETILITLHREADGRMFGEAEGMDLVGVMAYGTDRRTAIRKTAALALRSIADRIEHGELEPTELFFEVTGPHPRASEEDGA